MLARQQIPNLLTFARMAAVLVCLALIVLRPSCMAFALFWIFVAASLTDYLDGYLARKWGVVSPLGTLLDPIADKLLVAVMLVYILVAFGSEFLLPVLVILLRELYVSGLREFLAMGQIPLPVSKGGKWKTALQMIAIAALISPYSFAVADISVSHVGMLLLYTAAALAVISAADYTKASMKHLRATK